MDQENQTNNNEQVEVEDEIEINSQQISDATKKIVEDAQRIPQSLYCPFCSAEYMFEFTLKDHLLKFHTDDIKNHLKEMKKQNKDQEDMEMKSCPHCHAVFYYIGLLPKHIALSHGRDLLDEWRDENIEKLHNERENEPSINYINCSPGLSMLFDGLETCDSIRKLKRSESAGTLDSSPKVKSILKKTNNLSEKIIFSPASVSLRRSKGEIVKRSVSVRRELRFDLPPLPKSPEENEKTEKSKANKRKFFDWKPFSNKEKANQVAEGVSPTKMVKKNIKVKSCKLIAKTLSQQQHFITSTPNNALDDYLDESGENSMSINWKSAIKNEFRPSFFLNERFQCNLCKKTFGSNEELIDHIKENHSKLSLKPNYRCSQCGVKFYRNVLLVRHCTLHTPLKR